MEKNHGFWDKVDQDMKVMNIKNDKYEKKEWRYRTNMFLNFANCEVHKSV